MKMWRDFALHVPGMFPLNPCLYFKYSKNGIEYMFLLGKLPMACR